MTIAGIESIQHCIEQPGYFVKCLLIDTVAVFFPGSIQHRDVKREGVSYEDDYRGNALAATIVPGRIDIRFHQNYHDQRVSSICRNLLSCPDMAWARSFSVIYQGRLLTT
ncbi:hypothetical protein [Verrucomicrobium sp. BvORR106]|uniref:hypothetical protein n=1 Tax=Verrucomicrobium sp. BvORR106 TaxID=1403819 RepID=UPI00057185A7|nr:hypothetical protein [Verrucomicrobium sp. BvORR106]